MCKVMLTRCVLSGPLPYELVNVKVDLMYRFNTVITEGSFFCGSYPLKLASMFQVPVLVLVFICYITRKNCDRINTKSTEKRWSWLLFRSRWPDQTSTEGCWLVSGDPSLWALSFLVTVIATSWMHVDVSNPLARLAACHPPLLVDFITKCEEPCPLISCLNKFKWRCHEIY